MSLQPQTDTIQYFDLSPLGLLKVSGAGAAKLLQGQLSCDIDAITSGCGVMGAHCNPQGRVVSLFYVARYEDEFYLVMPNALLPIAMTALKKYAPFFKADLADSSGTVTIIGAWQHQALASAVATITVPASQRVIQLLTDEAPAVLNLFANWQHMDIQEGIPTIYPQTSGEFLPHDLNLPMLHAVCFTKGCYTGQEIIARMHYRGKPKKHLYRGLSNERLLPGAPLFVNDIQRATVIDSSETVYNNQYALLFVADEATVSTEILMTELGHAIELQKSE
jgi:folate-binding protein YgfZ